MSLLSAPGSILIKLTLMKSLYTRGVVVHQTVFLSKQVLTIVADRQRDAQTIEVPEAYTLVGRFSTMKHPLGQRGLSTSITAVDLIQGRNWILGIFYESNLTEARFEIILFSTFLSPMNPIFYAVSKYLCFISVHQ